MKCSYFVSYFGLNKNRCGYGNCQITIDHKINSMDDIRAIEEWISAELKRKGYKGKEYRVVNYKLLSSTVH